MTDYIPAPCPDVSVVVPTYREAENLPILASRVFTALVEAGLSGEMIVVDDASDDGTPEVCLSLAQRWPIRLITRYTERGLATAVIRGLTESRGSILVVMDADLSHPAEAIPALVEACRWPGADFVIGSRYVNGGAVDEQWSWFRRLNSRLATWLARGLTDAKDPMAGFFALTRRTFEKSDRLRPVGYKIGLELIVRCHCRNLVEIPIHFRDRVQGESKLNLHEQWQYLRHLSRLYRTRYSGLMQFLLFGLVGLSGMVVDLATYWMLLAWLPLTIARGLAILTAMTSNYVVNRGVTFADCSKRHPASDYVRFCAACTLGGITNWGVSLGVAGLHPALATAPLLAATVGVFAGSLLNYALCSRWVFDPGAVTLDECPHRSRPVTSNVDSIDNGFPPTPLASRTERRENSGWQPVCKNEVPTCAGAEREYGTEV